MGKTTGMEFDIAQTLTATFIIKSATELTDLTKQLLLWPGSTYKNIHCIKTKTNTCYKKQ